MKLMFASDIHGSSYFCRKMLEMWKKEKAGRLILLGDLLYHGPRNELPKEYAPKEVISLLNSMKNEICAVRGNCEAEVDQMVLDFLRFKIQLGLIIQRLQLAAAAGTGVDAARLPAESAAGPPPGGPSSA